MSKIIIPYKPRELQKHFHDNIKRWNVLVCHRRFGKTVMMINELIKQAVMCQKENPRFAYIAPTYKQAKQIAWDYIKKYASPIPNTKFNEQELRADLPNGARIQLLGADNPDAIRGIYLDGVVMDEYAQIKPSLFPEVINPALADRGGFAVFLGTPKGKNHFYDIFKKGEKNQDWYCAVHKSSETNHLTQEQLKQQQDLMTDDEFQQEFECSWEASIKGAFYTKEIQEAREENRICTVKYDNNLEVHTAWDIGWSDDTSIIFWQEIGQEIRIIDHYSANGMTVADYAGILKDKNYRYGKHYFPHDAFAKRMSDGKSTVDVARQYGIETTKTAQLSILEGINQARNLFKNIWFDKEKCANLIESLSQYRRDFDEKLNTFRQNPLHDWTSHDADQFRYMAISARKKTKSKFSEYDLRVLEEQRKQISPVQFLS